MPFSSLTGSRSPGAGRFRSRRRSSSGRQLQRGRSPGGERVSLAAVQQYIKSNLDGIGWLIAGGESGTNPEYIYDPKSNWKSDLTIIRPGRRTMKIEWAYALRLKAIDAEIPFYFKEKAAGRSGRGKYGLGFPLREFPNPPNGGTWSDYPEGRSII